MTTPFFSTIIPLYNKADTILRTLASVESQTFRDFEVIIINDGSTDDGDTVIQNSRFSNKCKLVSQPNKGVSAARNAGAMLANGAYLCFLDADDEWFPDYLQTMYNLIQKFPEAGIYGANFSTPKSIRGFKRDGYCDFFKEAAIKHPLNINGTIVPKNIFWSVRGFQEGLAWGEDYHFFFKIIINNKVAVTRKTLTINNHDAKENATQKKRDFSIHLLPHEFVIENTLRQGNTSHSIHYYACWAIRRLICGNILQGKTDDNKTIISTFTKMSQCVPELKLYNIRIFDVLISSFWVKFMALRIRLRRLGVI